MNKELIGVLFLAFVPGIVLVIASTVKNYGVAFLWCLGFEPVREKQASMLREMHPAAPEVAKAELTLPFVL